MEEEFRLNNQLTNLCKCYVSYLFSVTKVAFLNKMDSTNIIRSSIAGKIIFGTLESFLSIFMALVVIQELVFVV